MTPRYRWTQPICARCWYVLYPNREPVHINNPKLEFCAYCAHITTMGIYIRVDPSTVPFATLIKEA